MALRIGRRGGLLMVAALLAGCAGTTPYQSSAEQNVRVETVTRSGSTFSSVRASLHIYRVERGCEAHYAGTLALDQPRLTVGVPAGAPSLLVFGFESGGFLSSSSGSMRYETLLTPRLGHQYEIKVRHVDGIYDVAIHESQPPRPGSREIARRMLKSCAI